MKTKNGFSLLIAYVKEWDNYAMFSKLMNRMFDYLDRSYLKILSFLTLGVTSLKLFN